MHSNSNAGPHRTDAKRGNRDRVAPGVYLRGGKYEICWTQDGQTYWETLPAGTTKTDAVRAREAKRVDSDRGESVVPSKTSLSDLSEQFFGALEHDVQMGKQSERTLKLYRQRYDKVIVISPGLGRRPVQKIKGGDIEAVIRKLELSGLAPWTVRGYFVVFSALFTFAMKGDKPLIAYNPCSRLRKPPQGAIRKPKKRRLSDQEVSALIKAAPENWRTMIRVAAITGLRVSELLGLTWEDVDFNSETLHVRFQLSVATRSSAARRVRPKSNNSVRRLPLFDATKPLAGLSLASRFSKPADYVFCTREGKPLSQRNAGRAFEAAAKRAGVNAGWHDLRHTAISRWAARVPLEVDAATVAEWAGDRLETILAHYVHPASQDNRREQYRKVMAVDF
jgi:integrase